jgi:hypothetical protein
MPAQFHPGRLFITPGAEAVLHADELARMVRRHLTGDWGDLDAHDLRMNRDQLRAGGRVHSEYKAASGETIWIITDFWERVTTILLPEEY